MREIYDTMTDILIDVFNDDSIVATEWLTAKDVKGWDSLAHVRLVLQVERVFSIRFTASEVSDFKNVGELVHAIQRKRPNAGKAAHE